MESTEREYYAALFRRDYREAQRLYRVLSCTDTWSSDRVQREGHKCGVFDEADRYDDMEDELIEAPSRLPNLIAA